MKYIRILSALILILCGFFINNATSNRSWRDICKNTENNPVCGSRSSGRLRRLFKNNCEMDKANLILPVTKKYEQKHINFCRPAIPEAITLDRTPTPPGDLTAAPHPCSLICTPTPGDEIVCATEYSQFNSDVQFGIFTECEIKIYNCKHNKNIESDRMESCLWFNEVVAKRKAESQSKD